MEHKQELGHKKPKRNAKHDGTQNRSSSDPGDRSLSGAIPAAAPAPAPAPVGIYDPLQAAEEQDVSFLHDFVAGGIAGSASVIVGHPMDTLKVRMQTSTCGSSMWSVATSYGGLPSLYRGMAAPLSTACVINALIFSSYGTSSRLYDDYFRPGGMTGTTTSAGGGGGGASLHDSTIKAFMCGSFAGLVQALVICPQEHVKCRLQIQHGQGSPDHLFKGPVQAARTIVSQAGLFSGLYRGWWITCWREVPAFGAYFAFYDIFKDRINSYFVRQQLQQRADLEHRRLPVETVAGNSHIVAASIDAEASMAHHSHTWTSSALAGGLTGALTWILIYPFDVIKTKIQTMPLETPLQERRILTVTRGLVERSGWRHLFRGLTITCLRAFPVNGIIFPVYEYTLMHLCALEY